MVQDGEPSVIQDAQFEIASVLMESAIWLTKYGARVAGKGNVRYEIKSTVRLYLIVHYFLCDTKAVYF